MLHDRGKSHVERSGKFADRGRPLAQPLDHHPPGRIGQGLKGKIEGAGVAT